MTSQRTRRRRTAPRTPVPIVALAVIAVVFFALPLLALVLRVPWSDVGDLFTASAPREALLLSLLTSVIATACALVLGLPLAWVLARTQLPGRHVIRAVCTLTMVLPPVVAGVALLAALGRRGLIGASLNDWFGIRLPFTTPAVIIAQVFVAMPFLVLTVESALHSTDRTVEDAARTLGASPWTVIRRVTLPAVRPAILSGLVLTWARALGEFGATVTFAGNFPGTTRTLPVATYLALESDVDQALLMSVLLMVVSFVVLVSMRDRWTGAIGGRR